MAEKILTTIEKQRFSDWYSDDGRFGQHIMGTEATTSKEDILQDIEEMFHLTD